jgi:glycosyltransferase involved in cell wall biosynthesis
VRKLTEMGHEVVVSSYYGLSGSPTTWNGITVLPGYGQNYCSDSLGDHAKYVRPDLVINLGDVWVMDPNVLRQLPVAHWLPCDCRPSSTADRNVIEAAGMQVIAMSVFGLERYRDAGLDAVYVPHGIDTDVFRPLGNREEIRERLGFGDNFVIGMNAANNDAIRKAIPEQMLAFAKFLDRHPDTLLALHSGVHQAGGQDLEALAENLGISDRVKVVSQYHYHCGLITPEEIAEWYNAIDVLSACSFGEGFGLPIIEAQACGTPVITTDASSMPELNPLGISVDGTPFYNGVHKGWWTRPDLGELVMAYERSYKERPDDKLRADLREFALGYDKDFVAEEYMAPAIGELLNRVQGKAM